MVESCKDLNFSQSSLAICLMFKRAYLFNGNFLSMIRVCSRAVEYNKYEHQMVKEKRRETK